MFRTLLTRVGALLLLALATISAPTPAHAACPYTGNTAGTDSSAIRQALNDICANTDPAATQNSVPRVTGSLFSRPSANFTRPADSNAVASGDTICVSTTAGSCAPLTFADVLRTAGSSAWIFKASISTTDTAPVGATIVLHLYSALPTSAAGDNAAFSTDQAASHFCDIVVTLNTYAFTDGVTGAGVPSASNACMAMPASGTTIYGYASTLSGWTPSGNSKVWTFTLDAVKN